MFFHFPLSLFLSLSVIFDRYLSLSFSVSIDLSPCFCCSRFVIISSYAQFYYNYIHKLFSSSLFLIISRSLLTLFPFQLVSISRVSSPTCITYFCSGISSNIQRLRVAFDEDRVPNLYEDKLVLQVLYRHRQASYGHVVFE